jgi:bifunctional DNase/RNase
LKVKLEEIIDARTSDAITLARFNLPIFTYKSISWTNWNLFEIKSL